MGQGALGASVRQRKAAPEAHAAALACARKRRTLKRVAAGALSLWKAWLDSAYASGGVGAPPEEPTCVRLKAKYHIC